MHFLWHCTKYNFLNSFQNNCSHKSIWPLSNFTDIYRLYDLNTTSVQKYNHLADLIARLRFEGSLLYWLYTFYILYIHFLHLEILWLLPTIYETHVNNLLTILDYNNAKFYFTVALNKLLRFKSLTTFEILRIVLRNDYLLFFNI